MHKNYSSERYSTIDLMDKIRMHSTGAMSELKSPLSFKVNPNLFNNFTISKQTEKENETIKGRLQVLSKRD